MPVKFKDEKPVEITSPVGAGTSGAKITYSKPGQTDNVAALLKLAQEQGLGEIAKVKKPKLSPLQRLGNLVNIISPVDALTKAAKGEGAVIPTYGKDVLNRFTSVFTGNPIKTQQYAGKDLVETYGVKNAIAKFGLGFAADVLLDPGTYFGGAIIKGVGKAASPILKGAVKAGEAVAPELTASLKTAAEGTKDAFGRAFNYRYKTSAGLADELATKQYTRASIRENIFKKESEQLGTGIYTKAQDEELGSLVRNARRDTFQNIEKEQSNLLKEYNSAHSIKKPILTSDGALQELNRLKDVAKRSGAEAGGSLATKIDKLQRIVDTPKIIKSSTEGAGLTILKKDLKPELVAKAEALQKAGRPVPTVLRDLQQEAAARETFRLGKETGQKLVKQDLLSPDTVTGNYAPFIMKASDKQAQANLFSGTKSFGVGSEGYLEQFNAILGEDQLVKGAREAMAIRRSQAAVDIYTEKELRTLVSKYGKLKGTITEGEAKAAGMVPITRKGISSSIGDVVGYVSRDDARLLNAFIGTPEFATVDIIAKHTGFDAITGLFKRAVTGLFAPFHVRNWVSGLFQNFEVLGPHALSPKMMATGMDLAKMLSKEEGVFGGRILRQKLAKGILEDRSIELGGKVYKFGQLKTALENRFFGSTQIIDTADAMKYLADHGKVITPDAIRSTITSLGTSAKGVPFRAARKISEFIEMQQKSTAMVTALDMGKTLPEALDIARKAGFDYRELTGFESKVLRRILPFYAFSRFNTVLQIETLLKNPERVGAIYKFFQNMGDSPSLEERESLPAYLAQGFGVKVGTDKNNNPVYISSFGTPIEALTGLLQGNPVLRVISNMNPLLKTPLELGFGVDTFRQKDLKEVYTAKEYSAAPKFVKDLLQIKEVQKTKFLNGKPTKETYTNYVANPERLAIARSLFTSRGATYLDQMFDGDVTGLAKVLQLTTGIKPSPADLEATKAVRTKEQQRALEDLLIRYGAAREFRTVYEPKPKKSSFPVGGL